MWYALCSFGEKGWRIDFIVTDFVFLQSLPSDHQALLLLEEDCQYIPSGRMLCPRCG